MTGKRRWQYEKTTSKSSRDRNGGNPVYMHFHMHVIPRYAGGEDMVSWDPKPAKREELEKQGAKLREALKD